MLNARRPLRGFSKAFNSHLVSDGEDSTVCAQHDQNFFWSAEILSSEKRHTVMHEAIVAQLHPQDQCFLPRSAVSLHQKDRVKKEKGWRWMKHKEWME